MYVKSVSSNINYNKILIILVLLTDTSFCYLFRTDIYVCCHPVKVLLCIISVLSVVNIFVICTTLCTLLKKKKNERKKKGKAMTRVLLKNCGNKRNILDKSGDGYG